MHKIIIIFLLSLLPFAVRADEPAHSAAWGKSFTIKKLSVSLKNINDIGMLFIERPYADIELIDLAEWNLGISGAAEIDLFPYIGLGDNTLVFILWNKEGKKLDTPIYSKSFLSGWSFDYTLIGDGTSLFHETGGEEGKAGIAYWNVFFIHSNGDEYTLEPANAATVAHLANKIEEISTEPNIKNQEKSVNIAANIAIRLN